MNRRDAISRVALILGGTIVGAEAFLAGCKPKPETFSLFEEYDILLLDQIAETILPATDTPGAKEAKVGEFMARIVRDCYEEMNQVIFLGGIRKIDEESFLKYGATFFKITPQQQLELLTEIDAEQKVYTEEKDPAAPPHYFRLMKELTLWGFFTSEVGATKVLRYVEVPGRYDGCAPYKKGEKAWAT